MSPEIDACLRLLLAALLGAGIGMERELAHKAAGLRTHILICLGSALFAVISVLGFSGNADPSRIAAGVVTGIGFLGAGVIVRGSSPDHVVGITTAASVWVTAAIGVAAGIGLPLIAIVVTGITIIVLFLPKVKG